MTRLPRVTADEVIAAVQKSGFSLVRQSGSHRVFRNPEGKRVTVPYHKGRTVHPKVLLSIIKDMGITAAEFKNLLKSK